MRKFTLLFAALVIYTTVSAQSYEGTASYDKKTYPAVLADLPYSADVVEESVKNELKKRGFTSKSNKGFLEYKGITLTELGAERVDMYIKAERKSKKEKDATLLTILTAKGYDNFIGRASDGTLVDGVKTFADEITPLAEAYSLELEITGQDDVIKKAEKKYQGLVDDGNSMEKKRQKLEQDISDNKNNQAKQQQEVEAQRKVLDNLKAKRKS